MRNERDVTQRLAVTFQPVRLALFITILAGSGYVTRAAHGQQEDLRTSLFREVDAVLAEAQEARANILAPKSFSEGMKRYREAEEDLRRGRNLEGIRTKLRAARQYFQTSIEATKLANVTLRAALAARDDAEAAEAGGFAQEAWTEAERKFAESARKLEDGDVNDARKKAAEAESLYRQAELEAIKTNYLRETWQLLDMAEEMDVEDHAPLTLQRARELVQEAERLLNESRYDTDEPRALAQHAKSEAEHAIFLANRIREIDESDEVTMEAALLSDEEELRRIAGELGIAATFVRGLDATTSAIVDRIRLYEDSLATAGRQLADMRDQVAGLEDRIAELEDRLGGIAEERTELVQRMEAQARIRQKFASVELLFARDEARVLREGDDIIIRLVGLSFPSGQATIQPANFALLTKVQQAVAMFPGSDVVVEGHTDSFGGDEANLRLSKARADAVREYLLANMRIAPSRIEAIGYGESQPIASNDTPEGRARNRRTDIVIRPDLGAM